MKIRLALSALYAVLCITFLTGCGNSPDTTVKKWQAAIRDGNIAEADKYVTGKDATDFNLWIIKTRQDIVKIADDKDNSDAQWAKQWLAKWDNGKFDDVSISGDTATVTTPDPFGKEKNTKLLLKKIDGKWKIDYEASIKE